MRLRLRETLLYYGLKCSKIFSRRFSTHNQLDEGGVKRILAISCTALGDTLLSTPALAALRKAYPSAHITLLLHPSLMALFSGLDSVDELIPYSGKWKGFLRVACQLKQYDLAAIFHGNEPQVTPLAYLSGAQHIFKLPNNSRWGFLLSNRQPVLSWNDFGHGLEQRLAVARLAGASVDANTSWRMSVPANDQGAAVLNTAIAQLGWQQAPIIALQPGASTVSRRWPWERFVLVALELLRLYPQLRFVVTGSPAEAELCEKIASGIKHTLPSTDEQRVWVSAGELPLVALPYLLRRSVFMITGDTGPMHLAVTIGTPVIALFAVSDPTRSGPAYDLDRHIVIKKWRTCEPCLSKKCPYAEPPCMNNISVAEVLAAARLILERA